MSYEYTHISYREIDPDDPNHVTNYVALERSKEAAARVIGELIMMPGVFALRYIHYGEEPREPVLDPAKHVGATSYTDAHTRIGPPITP